MKMIASTKLAKAQRAMQNGKQYGLAGQEVFQQSKGELEEAPKKKIYLVISSDKGLCGGIHSGMSRKVRKMLLDAPNADLAVIGEKCKAQLSRSNSKSCVLSFAGAGKDIPTFADASAIADQISLLPTDYASIQIIYNSFINAGSYEATVQEAYSQEAITQSGMLY